MIKNKQMPQELKVLARRAETKEESYIYAPYLPWGGEDN